MSEIVCSSMESAQYLYSLMFEDGNVENDYTEEAEEYIETWDYQGYRKITIGVGENSENSDMEHFEDTLKKWMKKFPEEKGIIYWNDFAPLVYCNDKMYWINHTFGINLYNYVASLPNANVILQAIDLME